MIIADTGFWLALANRKDRHHEVARQRLKNLDEALVTTWPVVTETCYLLLERLGLASMQSYIHSFAGGAFTLSIRDCQPSPVALKKATTSGL